MANETVTLPQPKAHQSKKHWLVISYTSLLLFSNFVMLLICLAFFTMHSWHTTAKGFPVSNPTIYTSTLFGIMNIVFLVALLRKRKWGFWGYAVMTILGIAFSITALHTAPKNAVLSILGLVILYVILQLGGKKKAWNQLQ